MKKITLLFSLAMFSITGNATFYVVPGGSGAMDGSSWSNAFGDIQAAINAGTAEFTATSTHQEVWVKAGTYSTSSAPVLMKENVSIYGGFAGTETNKSQRTKGAKPWDYSNVTILNGENTRRAIEVAANFTNITIIDGFTIKNGNGQGTQLNNSGGGVVLRHNLKLQNSIVTDNTTSGNGGGINSVGGIIENCWVYNNTTTSATVPAAGGIYSAPVTPYLTLIENCIVEKNAQGGIRLQATGTTNINKTIIRNNSSTGAGAGIYTNNPGSSTITNCLITNNSGNNTIYLNKGKLINSNVSNNQGIIYLASATNIAELYNNIIVNNFDRSSGNPVSVSVAASYPANYVKNNAAWPDISVQTWGGETNNILTTDAATALEQVAFVQPTSFVGISTSNDQLNEIELANWSIKNGSYCFNKGDNSLIPSGITTDFYGSDRILYTTVDIGAYERTFYTAIQPAQSTFISYIPTSNGIQVQNLQKGSMINLYNAAGVRVVREISTGENLNISLSKGIYILQTNGKSQKISVN